MRHTQSVITTTTITRSNITAMSSDSVTPAQVNFIQSLAAARTVALGEHPEVTALPCNTKRDASRLIELIKRLPVDPDPSVPLTVAESVRHGVNRYEGSCTGCGNTVAANEGYYYLAQNGKYANYHKVGGCTSAIPQTPKVEVVEGFYSSGGEYFQVYRTRTGNLAAHQLSPSGSWVYRAGGRALLRSAADLTTVDEKSIVKVVCLRKYGALPGSAELAEIAAKYGAQRGTCIFCARALTDERSNPSLGGVGYGPTCAERYELPWGEVLLAK